MAQDPVVDKEMYERATGQLPPRDKPPDEGKGGESFEDIKKDVKPRRVHRKKPGKRIHRKKTSEAPEPEEPSLGGESVSSACAVTVVETIFTLGQAIGGEDWRPNENERVFMLDAWSSYFRAKGITDMPPGWAVLIATAAYSLPRLRKPKTQARVIAAYLRGRGWVRRLLGKKEDEAPPEDEK